MPSSCWPPPQPSARLRRRTFLGYAAGTALLRRRFGALVIDNLLFLPMFLPCSLVTGGAGPSAWLLYLAAYMVYFFGFELHSGQTLGKRAAGLRVVRADGGPVDAMAIGARNALRIIDGIPGPPLLGALSMTLTGKNRRRIGDLAAGTMVVEADEHLFLRGRRSPLIAIYPVLWIGTALVVGAAAGHGGASYLAKIDAVCRARVETERGAPDNFRRAMALSHQETRLIEALPYPSDLRSTRREVLALKYRVEAVGDGILRHAQTSADPPGTYRREYPQYVAAAVQANARFDAMGLHYCAQ
jgi:uncharacterized RDD family membrane protein YckC